MCTQFNRNKNLGLGSRHQISDEVFVRVKGVESWLNARRITLSYHRDIK